MREAVELGLKCRQTLICLLEALLTLFERSAESLDLMLSVLLVKGAGEILTLCVINCWLAAFFGDDVDCGPNDYSEEANFYHDVSSGSAHVLDIMLEEACNNASAEEMILPAISQWFSTMRLLQSSHHDISLCHDIDFFSRSQLMFWLANHSTPQKRRILAGVLVQVVDHHEAMAVKARENKSRPASLFGKTYRVYPT